MLNLCLSFVISIFFRTFAKSIMLMEIDKQIEQQKKWVEIGKNTIDELIEEGQPQEIIDYEREHLKADEKELERLLRQRSI